MLVPAKAAVILKPETSLGYSEDFQRVRTRAGPKEFIYGWALNRRNTVYLQPLHIALSEVWRSGEGGI